MLITYIIHLYIALQLLHVISNDETLAAKSCFISKCISPSLSISANVVVLLSYGVPHQFMFLLFV